MEAQAAASCHLCSSDTTLGVAAENSVNQREAVAIAMTSGLSVSVVVTTFNHGPLVVESVRSVLAQTRSPDEIIVIDDGSTDGTQDRLGASFGAAIRYIWQPNSGIARSRNRGMAEASCELIALMDGDDLWHVRKLELQVAAYERYPDSGLVAVRPLLFRDGDSTPILDVDVGNPPISSCDRLKELIEDQFIGTTSMAMIPRPVFHTVGPAKAHYELCSFVDLCCRIAKNRPVTMVEAPLAYWRYHPDSASGPLESRALRWLPEMISILEQARKDWEPRHAPMLNGAIRKHVRSLAWHAYQLRAGADAEASVDILRRLVRQYPWDVKLWRYYAAASSWGFVGRSLQR
jgi:glycosyltransferase involved in cell wall biosynthesis